MERCATRRTTRQRSARTDTSWSTPRRVTTVPVLPYLSFTFTAALTSTRYLWATEGRLAQILDNLLAQGKAVPMIVVVPDPHALPWETTPMNQPGISGLTSLASWRKTRRRRTRSFSTISFLLSRPTITSAMNLGSEQLPAHRWVDFKHWRPVSYTLAIFLG